MKRIKLIWLLMIAVIMSAPACRKSVSPAEPEPPLAPSMVRVTGIMNYSAAGVYSGREEFVYDGNNRIVTHRLMNAAGTETRSFQYQYDVNGKVERLDVYISSSFDSYYLYTYDTYGILTHYDKYDPASNPAAKADFIYDAGNRLTRKDKTTWAGSDMGYLDFVPGPGESYARMDIYNAGSVFSMRITQSFNGDGIMTGREYFNSSLVSFGTAAYILEGKLRVKVNSYDSNGTLTGYSDYQYEIAAKNMDKYRMDLYERIYADTGVY